MGGAAPPRNELAEPRKRDDVFAGLVARHSRLMYRVAYGLLRNAQDSEDAVQEAFLKLYRGEAWRQMEDEKNYLARTVWRVALDRLPKREERAVEQEEEFASGAESPEASAVRGAQSALLRRMIDALPEDLRRVLVLSAIEELNSREIAEMVAIPEGTVRTRLMRAKSELKRRFEAMKEARR
jgi:RNA polymerase sigma-70 factor (ECF subfamily)